MTTATTTTRASSAIHKSLSKATPTLHPREQPTRFNPTDLFSIIYTPASKLDPQTPDSNPALLHTTGIYLADPSHPFHTRTLRRLPAAFSTDRLHWRVGLSVELSKKVCVRTWARKRVERAIVTELGARGLDREGRALEQGTLGLNGGLLIALKKTEVPITASGEEVREAVKWAVERIARKSELQKESVASGLGAEHRGGRGTRTFDMSGGLRGRKGVSGPEH